MTTEQVKQLKAKIKAEMLRRDGNGSLASYGSSSYDFSATPTAGSSVKAEYGEKTINLLLQIEDYGDLSLVNAGDPIPQSFNSGLINEVNRLAAEEKTGESEETAAMFNDGRVAETSSCRGMCTGLCVGTCIDQCNGCTGCTATCGSGCTTGCSSCTGATAQTR